MRYLFALFILFANPALAQKPLLKDVKQIEEGMLVISEGYIITEKCESIEPRWISTFFYLNGMSRRAKNLGYTQTEIDAYTSDKDEQDRLTEISEKVLAKKGAKKDKPETYCTIGLAEIEAGTQIGRLLREK